MSLREAINKFIEVIQSNDFIEYEKDLSAAILEGLSSGYAQGLDEPDLVKCIRNVVNRVNKLNKKISTKPRFQLITRAVFIHGYTSQVKFDYYD
jgi:hypothetical protein